MEHGTKVIGTTLFYFFFDFLAAALADQWVIYALLSYYIVQLLDHYQEHYLEQGFIILCLLVQDHLRTGRFGLGLLYIVPILVCGRLIRTYFMTEIRLFHYILVTGGLLVLQFIIPRVIFSRSAPFWSTVTLIFANIIVIRVVNEFYEKFGVRGNRSLLR